MFEINIYRGGFMSFYKMEITGSIGLTEYSDIHDYFSIVEPKDNFIIFVDDCSENNLEILISLLRESNFSIIEKDYNEDGCFYVKVYKNLN